MWIAKKTAQIGVGAGGSDIGVVSVGGLRPAVVTDGEVRGAQLLAMGGALYVPKVGDEVLLERTNQEEKLVIGRVASESPEGVEAGELVICLPKGGGRIHIKNGGEIEISGEITLKGTTNVEGTLLINGAPYVPPLL